MAAISSGLGKRKPESQDSTLSHTTESLIAELETSRLELSETAALTHSLLGVLVWFLMDSDLSMLLLYNYAFAAFLA